jgi:succinoglycan biosynthesis transport protein ExoP
MEVTNEPGLTDYFAALRRRRWLVICVALPLLVTTTILFFALPTFYRSVAVFRFETPAVADLQGGGTDARNNYLDEYVSKLEDTVLSAASLAKLRTALGIPTGEGAATPNLPKRIHVDIVTERVLDPDSARQKDVNSGFTVYYDSPSPKQAQVGSEWLAAQFLNLSRQNRHDRAMQAASFLQTQADSYRDSIATMQSRIADFKQQHVNELPEAANVVEGDRTRADMDLSNIEQELATLRQNRVFLQLQLQQSQAANPDVDAVRQLQDEYNRKLATYDTNHPDMIALKRQIDELQRTNGVPGSDSLQAQLENQRAVLAQTRQRYSEDHPDVKRLERAIASLQARIAAGEKEPTTTSVTNPVVVQLQTQLNANDSQTEALTQRQAKLEAKLASLAGQVSAAPQVAKQYEMMTNDLKLAQDKYDELLKRKMDSETTAAGALAGSGDEFRLLQPPGTAVQSNKSKAAIGIIGVLLACILSLGTALSAEVLDQTVRGSNDVRSLLDVVPLATVPEVHNSRYSQLKRGQLMRLAFSFLVGVPILYFVIQFAVGLTS